MLRIAINLQHPAGSLAARRSEAMAHRRRLVKGRVGLAALGLLLVGTALAGSVFVSNKVTRLRKNIAVLEADKVCRRAEYARLQARWNTASSPAEITRRAGLELGLVVPEHPALVLAEVRKERSLPLAGIWRALQGWSGGNAAQAAEWPVAEADAAESTVASVSPIRLDPRFGNRPDGKDRP